MLLIFKKTFNQKIQELKRIIENLNHENIKLKEENIKLREENKKLDNDLLKITEKERKLNSLFLDFILGNNDNFRKEQKDIIIKSDILTLNDVLKESGNYNTSETFWFIDLTNPNNKLEICYYIDSENESWYSAERIIVYKENVKVQSIYTGQLQKNVNAYEIIKKHLNSNFYCKITTKKFE
ncbi:hypothetical protein FDE98_19710 [Clostridium sporogenes]|uniref:Uncharacterized protein n=1 Tax=Clostridium sporogenes TaxID=1509 RepID=A0A7X5SY80_CLOSG|nr:hypothetical protein [Clostridium sporogenes]AJD29116.1 membrane associated sensory transduction histidine kinase domain protein [Clostridium botulinum Prevot_594]NFL98555.1 hypothetical protein [Clostridium botulinum]NFP55489.1 hypothetical protein [Clostridium botulinum]NFQ18444.1 hypothetical protein [Clostridium sporogenes]NFQ21045.1 hypothetical protein [Clostridium sporogenes]